MEILITIQSARREFYVKRLENKLTHCPCDIVWTVPEVCLSEYENVAGNLVLGVEGVMPMKPVQLNFALNYAKVNGYDYLVTMDDDLVGAIRLDQDKKRKHIDLYEYIDETVNLLHHSDYYLAGTCTTSVPLWLKNEIKNYGHLQGGLMVHKISDDLVYYDEGLKCNEDTDIAIAHHIKHLGLIRDERFIVEFEMAGRKKFKDKDVVGGYEGFRSNEKEMLNTKLLQEKYKEYETINFKYEGEGKSNMKGVKWRKIKDEVLAKRNDLSVFTK